MTKITKETVDYISELSRIHLTQEESDALAKNLEKILSYIKTLEELDTKDIKPTSHVLSLENVFRQDTVLASLDQKKVLAMAPEELNGSFKVPKVIE